MQSDGAEREVLEELSKKLLMKRDEIINFLQGKVDNPKTTYANIIENLKAKGFIKHISPIGESVVTITQKGIREVNL